MLLFFQQTLLDTCLIFESDSLQNAKIYYHETIKLIESTDKFSSLLNLLTVLVAVTALAFSIWYNRRSNKYNEENLKLSKEIAVESNKPLINLWLENVENSLYCILHNNGGGTAIINSIFYTFDSYVDNNILNLFLRKLNEFENKPYEVIKKIKNNGYLLTFTSTFHKMAGSKQLLFIIPNIDNDLLRSMVLSTKVYIRYEDIFNNKKELVEELLIGKYLTKSESEYYSNRFNQ